MSIRLVACLGVVLATAANAAKPWDEPFAKDTNAILQAARAVTPPDNPAVVILLEEHRYAVHADGRTDLTYRKVYQIRDQEAVEDWSSIEQEYQPWHQQDPEIRARVITATNTVHPLDPKTVASAPSRQFDATIYSDSRVLRAPLPSVAKDSVIEVEITVRDKSALLDAGVAHRIEVEDVLPIERFHAVIDADPGANFTTASQLIPESALHRTTAGGHTRLECELEKIEVRKRVEFNLPPGMASRPYLAFATGKSWQAVAARYEAIVNQRLQAADLKALLDGVDIKGSSIEVASRLSSKLHKSVRYTGVEFGEAAIVPNAPAEVIKRGYGDCKDKATLLVALLRAAGLKADVALLDAGMATDVDADLPGLGHFNHAIVYVASTPALWIDATAADTRVGFLPSADQGRLALIANRETVALVRTPESTTKDNTLRHTIEVTMSDFGPGVIRDMVDASGSFEAEYRGAFTGDEKKLKQQLDGYVKRQFAAKSAGAFEFGHRDDIDGPFHLSVEAQKVAIANTGSEDAGVALTPWLVFDDLPWALRLASDPEASSDAKADERKPRQHDFVNPQPYQAEYRYKIIPPALFKITKVPKSEEFKLGDAIFSRKYQSNPDGTFEAIFRFDTGKRTLTATEFEALRTALKPHLARKPEVIAFVPETAEHLAIGQYSKALSLIREDVARHKDSASAHARYARMLLTAGLGGAALAEAKIAVDLDPKSSIAWQTLAQTWEHDTFGRRVSGNWNYDEAEKALRKAIELDPEDQIAPMDLAILLEHNRHGWRYARDARLDDAIALYREILKKKAQPVLHQNLAIALLRAGKLDESREEAKKGDANHAAVLDIVITAVQESPARAIVSAQAAVPDPRQRALYLAEVAATLVQIRQYAPAAVVAAAAARLSPELQGRAEMTAKLKRWEDTLLPETDPAYPFQRLILELFRGNLQKEAIQPYVSRRANFDNWQEEIASMQDGMAEAFVALASLGLEREAVVDFTLSLVSFAKGGAITETSEPAPGNSSRVHVVRSGTNTPDDPGFLMQMTGAGSAETMSVWVVREDGKFKILGTIPDGLELAGELVLDLLAANDLKGARWWLDKIAANVQPRSDGTGSPSINGLWSGVTEQSRGPNAIRLAAASLIGAGTGETKAIKMLEEGRAKATLPLDKWQIDKALCEAFLKAKKWDELATAARRLQASKTFSEEGFRYLVKADIGTRNWKDLAAEAQKRYDSNNSNTDALRTLALAKAHLGDTAAAVSLSAKAAATEFAGDSELLVASWIAIVAGKIDQAALDRLKNAKSKTSVHEYTLALMQALNGAPDDALQTFLKAVAQQNYEHLDPIAWIAYARICDQFGLASESESALAHGKPRRDPKESDDWAAMLAAAPARH
jgi:tetratricopeptide (TPR) repeat protein